MIYPDNFETKIGIDRIRKQAAGYCLYEPGKEVLMKIEFSADPDIVKLRLMEVEEFRSVIESNREFPIENFIDISGSLSKLNIEGRYLEEEELFNIRKVLDSVRAILNFLKKEETTPYASLRSLASEVNFFPIVLDRLNSLMNKHGRIRDNASKELSEIRRELGLKESTISRRLNRILEKARKEGWVEEDAVLTVRNGRTVIPVPSSYKKKIGGYIHDESATGKTAYIEPSEIVEANNEIRELESREKREIIRILTEVSVFLRPYREDLLETHGFLAKIDSIRARALFALDVNAIYPQVKDSPEIDWSRAVHPILLLTYRESAREKEVVPLDIKLDDKNRILIISGPNAGGKSVCLQTLGILQYMIQTGFLVPVNGSSVFGIFKNIFLDMGDEQSIEDDLSTYSSHLLNMKYFTRNADRDTLILIDEFGSGTEPTLGAAIAEAVLEHLNSAGTFGLITTHYTNLKHFASTHDGLINGAMLFDTAQMKPLFQLLIGRPGSSFAFEIARKIGLPEDIIKLAEEKVGQQHVDYDRALKDLIRDKKYWENKRQRIRVAEKKLNELVERYDIELSDTEKLRKKIIQEARTQAETLLAESNRKIENTIREIREAEAGKERTRQARKSLEGFREKVAGFDGVSDPGKSEAEELKQKIQELRLRNEQVRRKKPVDATERPEPAIEDKEIRTGDFVRLSGQDSTGQVIEIRGKNVTVAFGHIKTRVKAEQLEKLDPSTVPVRRVSSPGIRLGDWDIGKRKIHFSPDIDIRGKRADEALKIIADFIDEAIMVQVHDLRILHGKGNGILRELIRQQLSVMDVVEWYGDEHVDRGGAGITVLKLGT